MKHTLQEKVKEDWVDKKMTNPKTLQVLAVDTHQCELIHPNQLPRMFPKQVKDHIFEGDNQGNNQKATLAKVLEKKTLQEDSHANPRVCKNSVQQLLANIATKLGTMIPSVGSNTQI